jgi:hypothetical protein
VIAARHHGALDQLREKQKATGVDKVESLRSVPPPRQKLIQKLCDISKKQAPELWDVGEPGQPAKVRAPTTVPMAAMPLDETTTIGYAQAVVQLWSMVAPGPRKPPRDVRDGRCGS